MLQIGIVVNDRRKRYGFGRGKIIFRAEEKDGKRTQSDRKPFMILLNCKKPYTEESKKLQEELREKYETAVLPVNCEQMKEEDIHEIMRQVSMNFRSQRSSFMCRNGVEMLSREHKIKQDLLSM